MLVEAVHKRKVLNDFANKLPEKKIFGRS